MNMLAHVQAVLLSAAALAACSSTPPAPPPAAPSASPVPIDGTYDGIMQLIRGDGITCGNQNPINLHVVDRTFSYRLSQPQADWRPVLVFAAVIAPDGAFNAQTGDRYMRGTVSGGHMQGEIAGDVCGFSFVADRGGTW